MSDRTSAGPKPTSFVSRRCSQVRVQRGGACDAFDALRGIRNTPLASRDPALGPGDPVRPGIRPAVPAIAQQSQKHLHPFKTLNYSTDKS